MHSVAEMPYALDYAFHYARCGRPGPVFIDVPKDIQMQTLTWEAVRETLAEKNLPMHQNQVWLDGRTWPIVEKIEPPTTDSIAELFDSWGRKMRDYQPEFGSSKEVPANRVYKMARVESDGNISTGVGRPHTPREWAQKGMMFVGCEVSEGLLLSIRSLVSDTLPLSDTSLPKRTQVITSCRVSPIPPIVAMSHRLSPTDNIVLQIHLTTLCESSTITSLLVRWQTAPRTTN